MINATARALGSVGPEDAAVFLDRAAAYASKGELDRALVYYSAAIRLAPGDEEAIRQRARLYMRKKKYASALEDYGSLIRINPDVRNYLCRAMAYASTGENAKAVADYTEAIRLEPDDPSTYSSRVNIYVKTGEWDKAIGDYTQLIRLHPDDRASYYGRSEAYFKKKDYEHAIADVSSALRVGTGDPEGLEHQRDSTLEQGIVGGHSTIIPLVDSLVMRGTAYSRIGEYEEAGKDFDKAMSAAETSPLGYNAAALFYATCPKPEFRNGAKAVDLAMQACKLSAWKNDEIIDTLAASEAEAGNWKEAVDYEKMAMGMAAKRKDTEAAKEYEVRIVMYKAHMAFRQEAEK